MELDEQKMDMKTVKYEEIPKWNVLENLRPKGTPKHYERMMFGNFWDIPVYLHPVHATEDTTGEHKSTKVLPGEFTIMWADPMKISAKTKAGQAHFWNVHLDRTFQLYRHAFDQKMKRLMEAEYGDK